MAHALPSFLSCLERDPARRQRSPTSVAIALTGADRVFGFVPALSYYNIREPFGGHAGQNYQILRNGDRGTAHGRIPAAGASTP